MINPARMLDFPLGQRFDARFLDPDLYPERVTVRPRFQDLDPLNHVNNVAMAAMFEDARVRFNYPMRQYFHADGIRTMIAGVVLNYVAGTHLRPDLVFHIGVGHIGRTSWTLQTCALQGDGPTLLGLATMVTSRDGKAVPLPDGLREALEARRLGTPA